ncbi:hypothetical protein BKA67DRAFT_563724 [Truncatella angustata]|uniref:Uncharacterized protein n=1 Tax=Truncatella angustata TaxID=152316 RepID=A0A9P8UKN0_9PEZI|nr:uncharacterized protein BKA67DRAFT_563724 [Truncatella angustata]KAH6653954.1 hypothetical protein BKA67DRAFT_563724 [Truncatella angustata]KAH8198062.1 hypothetical protein TruAng_007786 [Truncatella angustata]
MDSSAPFNGSRPKDMSEYIATKSPYCPLRDYQMQLMFLEEQNKRRLRIAREKQLSSPQSQERDNAHNMNVETHLDQLAQKLRGQPSLVEYQAQLDILEQENQDRLHKTCQGPSEEPQTQFCKTACGTLDVSVSPPSYKHGSVDLEEYQSPQSKLESSLQRELELSMMLQDMRQGLEGDMKKEEEEEEELSEEDTQNHGSIYQQPRPIKAPNINTTMVRSPHDMNGWPNQSELPDIFPSQPAAPEVSCQNKVEADLRSPHDMNALPDQELPLVDEPAQAKQPETPVASRDVSVGIHALRRQPELHDPDVRKQTSQAEYPQFAPASFEYPGVDPTYALDHQDTGAAYPPYYGKDAVEPPPLHFAPASFEYSGQTLGDICESCANKPNPREDGNASEMSQSASDHERKMVEDLKRDDPDATAESIVHNHEERKAVSKSKRDHPEAVAQARRRIRQRQSRSMSPPHNLRVMRIRRRAGCPGITRVPFASAGSLSEREQKHETEPVLTDMSLHEGVSLAIRLRMD